MSRLTQEQRKNERNTCRFFGKSLGVDPDALPIMIALEELEEHEAKLAKIEAIIAPHRGHSTMIGAQAAVSEIIEVLGGEA